MHGKLWVQLFLQNLGDRSDQEWVLLILDGFGCHGNDPEILEELEKEKVLVVAIPAHTSDVLQPLDLANFGPLKKYFRQKVQIMGIKFPGIFLERHEFPAFMKVPLDHALRPENILAGWKKAGISPIDYDLHKKLSGTHRPFEKSEKKAKKPKLSMFSKEEVYQNRYRELEISDGFSALKKRVMNIYHLNIGNSEDIYAKEPTDPLDLILGFPSAPMANKKKKKTKRTHLLAEY